MEPGTQWVPNDVCWTAPKEQLKHGNILEVGSTAVENKETKMQLQKLQNTTAEIFKNVPQPLNGWETKSVVAVIVDKDLGFSTRPYNTTSVVL